MNIYHKLNIEKNTSWGGGIEGASFLIKCPICGFDYNHILKSKHIPGKDDYKAWEGRGDAVKVFIQGECGHYWNLCIGFHKGNLYLFCESLEVSK
jgi:hypothetical protein